MSNFLISHCLHKKNYFFTLVLLIHTTFFVYAQEAQFTFSVKEKTIKEVFQIIEKESPYRFIYNDDFANLNQKVSLEVKGESIETILGKLLNRSEITYKILENNLIVITPGEAQARPVTVRGRITDASGEGLAGATVMVKGDVRKFAVADVNGQFVLENVAGMAVLTVSCIGYLTVEVAVGGRSEVKVTLTEDVIILENVVVTGYQTISRARTTGVYSVVTTEELEQRPSFNISDAMNGLVPGLVVQQVDGQTRFVLRGQGTLQSGQEDRDPLIVVDGFPIQGFTPSVLGGAGLLGTKDPFATINPNDVESITVLKDAAATSIYGARAANGVIVITTKKGIGEEKMSVNINSLVSVGSKLDLDHYYDMASVEAHLWYMDNLRMYTTTVSGATNPWDYPTNPTLYLSGAAQLMLEYYRTGNITEEEYNRGRANLFADEGKWKDDLNKCIYKNRIQQQHSLSIRGNSDKHDYSFSTSYDKEDSYMRGAGRERVVMNFMNNFRFNKKMMFNVGVNTGIVNSKSNWFGTGIEKLSFLSPWSRLVDDNGNYVHMPIGTSLYLANTVYYPILMERYADRVPVSWFYNPAEDMHYIDNSSRGLNVRVNAGLDFSITNNLKVKVGGQYEYNHYTSCLLYEPESYFVRNLVNRHSTLNAATNKYDSYFPAGGIYTNAGDLYEGYILRAQADYDKRFGNHVITVLAGTEVISSTHENNPSVTRYGYNKYTNAVLTTVDYVTERSNIFGVNARIPYNALGALRTIEDRFFSAYMNAQYTYDNRYTLSGSLRTDASNYQAIQVRDKFSPFWSLGAAWLISNEKFMQDVKWVDFLKLRASIGEAGLAAGKSGNSSIPTVGVNAGSIQHTNNEPYNTISSRGNPTLTWEKSRTFDIGIEFNFWNNKLHGNVSYYNRYSYDVLAAATVPAISQGTGSSTFNNAAISNKGIEFSLGSRLTIVDDLKWNGLLTFSYNKNEVRRYSVINTNIRPSIYVGYPVNNIWAFNVVGYTKEGFIVMKGRDGTLVTVIDRETSQNTATIDGAAGETIEDYNWSWSLGSRIPVYNAGFTTGFTYKGISLSFLFTGKFGYRFYYSPSFTGVYSSASYPKALERAIAVWEEGYGNQTSYSLPPLYNEDNAAVFTTGSGYTWTGTVFNESTGVWYNGNHIRLNEIYLGYELPAKYLNKVKFIGGINLYAQARDLGVIWSTNKEWDPDFLPGTIKPPATFTFGLKFNIK